MNCFPFSATQQWFTASYTVRTALILPMSDLILIINNILALKCYSSEKRRKLQYYSYILGDLIGSFFVMLIIYFVFV